MLQEIYVAIGLVTFVYFLLKKKRQRRRDKPGLPAGREAPAVRLRQGVVEITPLQPPSTDSGSPMSVCDSDEDLMDVTPHIQEDYMELYQKQTTHT